MVHQHERRAAARGELSQFGLVQQAADVVDDRRAAVERRLRDARFVGVDRDGHTSASGEPVEDRQDSPQFFVR